MKNILSIDANTRTCTLLSNLDNGENSIVLDIEADVSKNPILQIMWYNIEITSADFEYTIPESMYIGSVVLRFRIADDDGYGPAFAIHPVESVSGNLYLKYVSDREYQTTCVKDGRQRIIDMIYPVGSIYISANETSPSALFGGTWEQIKDKFLLSAGDTYGAGTTGGEAAVKLTAAQSGIPAHSHGLNSHTHSLGNHAHSLNSHTHSLGGHTHNVPNAQGYNANSSAVGRRRIASGSAAYTIASTSSSDMLYGATTAAASGNTGAASGNTGAASGNTGAASGNTANNTVAEASQAHNNMPPYLAVYVWKRTA